jgi:hypothetical protein
MTKLNRKQIQNLAIQIVHDNPGGIRHADLLREVQARSIETPFNSIRGAVWNLASLYPTKISKPTRGLFAPYDADSSDFPDDETFIEEVTELLTQKGRSFTESDFYAPFGEWLKSDLDEVTTVAALGGSGLKTKWGTPDVVGAYKPLASHIIKFPLEIVSAEIKISKAPVVAFGQAVAYRLFSTKSYIAMPTTLAPVDQSRLEALCMLFGVGLALFDLDPDNPNFSIRVRAQRFSPDMFYVNEFADRLKDHDPEVFERLFA